MNKPMIKIVQVGCVVVSLIIFALISSTFNEYFSYSSYRNNAVTFEDYYYSYQNKDFMQMAEFSYQKYDGQQEIDPSSFINFSAYYALLQTYLATHDVSVQNDCLQQMQELSQKISFYELTNEIDRLNQLYHIDY